MTSTLTIVPVERLQETILRAIKPHVGSVGMYVSLNKSQESSERMLSDAGIPIDKLLFVDGVIKEKTKDEVLHIPPDRLDLLSAAATTFFRDIPGKKFLQPEYERGRTAHEDLQFLRYREQISVILYQDGLLLKTTTLSCSWHFSVKYFPTHLYTLQYMLFAIKGVIP